MQSQFAATMRSDIQGLRALAVLAVMLYHARVPGFTGGFCGVDVFFVISGFLITGLLVRDLALEGRIDMIAFWARRAWRLLPNALAVLLATLALVWWLVPPNEQGRAGKDIASAIFYVANYRFALSAVDYFDHLQAASPVLHFWSLNVEEQFYFVWPLLLAGLAIFSGGFNRRRTLVLAGALAIASFAVMMLILAYHSQPLAFFGAESRVWQLATGAMLAIAAPSIPFSPRMREYGARASLAAVVACAMLLDDQMHYPGWLSVLPVAATALLIALRMDTAGGCGRLLGWPAVQWVGLRSYSLYLWHWPMLILVRSALPEGVAITIAVLVATVGISAVSFASIEQPLRYAYAASWPSWRRLAAALAVSALVAAMTATVTLTLLLRDRDTVESVRRIELAKADVPRLSVAKCGREDGMLLGACRFGAPDAKRTVVLFGDSFAEHLIDGLEAAARRSGWAFRPLYRRACAPIDVTVYNDLIGGPDKGCDAWREQAIGQLIADPPELVVISAAAAAAFKWRTPVEGRRLDREVGVRTWSDGLSRVLRRLRETGIQVAVVRTTPRGIHTGLAKCMTDSLQDQCATPRAIAIESQTADQVAASIPGVQFVDLTDKFCSPNVCYSVRNGMIVYRDSGHHITATFALSLAPVFADVLRANAR